MVHPACAHPYCQALITSTSILLAISPEHGGGDRLGAALCGVETGHWDGGRLGAALCGVETGHGGGGRLGAALCGGGGATVVSAKALTV